MIKINIKYIFIILINIITCGYLFGPEHIGLSGSGSTAYNDFSSSNPATISKHEGLSIRVFGGNFGLGNNFLSISDYNDINGSNFDDSESTNYFPKSEVMSLFDDGMGFNGQLSFSMPFSDIVYNNFSFSSKTYFWIDANLPSSIMDLTLYGNQFDKQYKLNIDGSMNLINEFCLGYGNYNDFFSYGFRFKYLQGIASSRLKNISQNSSYFSTDSLGFLGKAEYLRNQVIGGSSIAFDIGLITNKSINGWHFGFSLNNLFAKIKWDQNNITYKYLKNSVIKKLPLRFNEKQYITINLDTLNAINMINIPANEIFEIENFKVIELEDLQNIHFIDIYFNEIGDTIYTSEYGKIIETNYDSFLIESSNIPDDILDTLNANFKTSITEYPIFFNIGSHKEIDKDVVLTIDLSTGFNNSIKNSENWKLSTGLIFNRFKNVPLTFGLSFGGKDKINSGFSFGYNRGPFKINYGIGTRHGVFLPSWRGLDFSVSIDLKIN